MKEKPVSQLIEAGFFVIDRFCMHISKIIKTKFGMLLWRFKYNIVCKSKMWYK